jgi:phasin
MHMAEIETKTARGAKTGAEKTTSAAREAAKGIADAAFSYPKFEMPEAFRSLTEQSLTQTREAYAQLKTAAEEATDILEDGFETARVNMRDVQFKALDLVKANADATFDLVRKLLTTSSPAEAFQLQTAFARERFEALVDYSKDVQTTLNKAGEEATKPAKALFERSMSFAKAA